MKETLAKFAIIAFGCLTTWYWLVHTIPLPAEVPIEQAPSLLFGLAVAFGPIVWMVGCLLYMVLEAGK